MLPPHRLLGEVVDKELRAEDEERREKAIDFFNKSIAADPSFYDAYVSMGICYSALRRYKEAAVALEQAISIKPNELLLYFFLAEQYFSLDEIREELKVYDRILQIDPNNVRAYYELGLGYEFRADWDEGPNKIELYKKAIDSYWHVIKIKPDDGDAYNHLGSSYLGLELYPFALEAFEQAIRLDPDSTASHYGLMQLYDQLGDKESAKREDQIIRELEAKAKIKRNKPFGSQ
jgi:tetratricopeptide (TPR) repeat protein